MSDKDKLNNKQECAIELILKGMNDSEVAEQIGTSRQCVNQWRNQDVIFIQALQERRQVLRAAHMEKLLQMVGQALDVIEDALEDGDAQTKLKTAMYVLKLAGFQEYGEAARQESAKDALLQALKEVAEELGYEHQ
ncbi:MAG: helix-turn-helix domain-containing protein [Pelolinea sp.]|nr:helix-turn-helix domain-containing protein [Pelolinea sp.]